MLRKIKNRLLSNPRLRFGSFSVLLSVLVTTALILLVIAFDHLEDKYALQRDLSFNGATTQSRITTEVLNQLDKEIHIYVISSDGNTNQTILSLLKRYESITPAFTFSEEKLARSPQLLTMFNGILGEGQVTSDCMIVYCSSTSRARVLKSTDFPVYEYSTESGYYIQTGYNYEKPITEAIVYVSQDDPLCIQMLSGHNELSGENLSNLQTLLTDANYLIQTVNLLNGDTLDPAKPLMILSPKLDISEKELSLLMEYADGGGDFFILSNYSDPFDLPNYNALLLEYGIQFYPGLVISELTDTESYYDDLPAFLMPHMVETDLTRNLIGTGRSILMLPGSRALKLPETSGAGLGVETLLATGNSYIRNYTESEPDSTEKQITDQEGVFALAVLSKRLSSNGKVSNAEIIGNTLMFTDYWVESNTYSADFLYESIQYLQGESPISLNIAPKENREPLRLGSLTPLYAMIFLLPLLVLFAALFVLLPRKNL